MPQNIFICTSNRGKRFEFEKFFSAQSQLFQVYFPNDDLEIEESGNTFYQNAFIKAKAWADHLKNKENQSWILAEDSGLILEDFPELLGVQTARYQAHLPTYEARAQQLLAAYDSNKGCSRRAYFVSVLCLWKSAQEVYFFQGQVRGHIAKSWRVARPEGPGAFGYDPLFMPEISESKEGASERKTFGEDPSLKERHCHRVAALGEMMRFLAVPRA